MYPVWQIKLLTARVLGKARIKRVAPRAYLSALKSAPERNQADIHFRLAFAYSNLEDFAGAKVHLHHALAAKPEISHWWYRLGVTHQRLNEHDLALTAFERVLLLKPTQTSAQFRIAQSLGKLNDGAAAMNALRPALAADPGNKKYHALMIEMAKKTNQQPLIRSAIEAALANVPATRRRISSLVSIYEAAGEHDKILALLQTWNQSAAVDAQSVFWEGRALAGLARTDEARATYLRAIELLEPKEQTLGPGIFFEKERRYQEAIKWYEEWAGTNPGVWEIHYHLGRCLEAEYEWSRAEASYRVALAMPQAPAHWHGRLGVCLEHQGHPAQAAVPYATAASMDERADDPWSYRLAKVFFAAGDHDAAADVLLRASTTASADLEAELRQKRSGKKRKVAASIFEQYEERALQGLARLRDGEYAASASSLEDALFRSSSHNRSLYMSLARALEKAGRREEALDTYAHSRLVESPFGLDYRGLLKARESQLRIYYSEFQLNLPIDESAILYESGAGLTIACNPLAICRELLERDEYSNYRHFWAVGKHDAVPEYLRADPRVFIIRRNSDLYLKMLASAKYLINNNTFPTFFSRRPEQRYLNTWHGVPLKTLGVDIKNGQMDHRNAARNLLHASHLIMPNDHTQEILLERYDIQGLFTGKVAQIGSPRIDNVLRPRTGISAGIRQRLDITASDRVLLYAPTWRGDLQSATLDEDRIMGDLKRLEATGFKVLFRGHTMVESLLADSALQGSLVPADIDTNDLLAVVDVLVTDYSSIFFDFIPTGKPIFYYAYDLAEYQDERGMYFDLEDMPGEVCFTIDALTAGIENLDSLDRSADPDYVAAMEKFCAHEDGNATQRAIDFFFHDIGGSPANMADGRINTLIYQGSFIPNGITSAFTNLIANIDLAKIRPVVVVVTSAVFSRPEREANLRALGDKIQTLGVAGGQAGTLEERIVISEFNERHEFGNESKSRVYFAAYEREFHRLFGTAQFDSVVSFEGFQRHWSALMAAAPAPRLGRSIMLHSAMKRERDTRFHQLRAIFNLYPRFDRLISVSKSANEVNRADIMAEIGIPADRFVVAENLLDVETVTGLGQEPVDQDIEAWMSEADYCFINVARLSPEKDHEKLLRALAQARSESGLDIRLVLIGDGPTANALEELSKGLSLDKALLLTGRLENPHPYVKAADCFAFSSNYEGQGIAVLEALVLGTPVISTDVVGPRSVLEGGFGALVENSVDGLAVGMQHQAIDRPTYLPFDAAAYNADALRKFNHFVFGL